MCDVSASEACVQPLPDTSKICALPSQGLRSCSMDTQCMTGEKCCGIYGQSYCMPTLLCPVSCTDGSGCNTGQGEICCTAVATADPALSVPGLCLHPNEFTCPRTCSQSSECRTQDGEICCEGVCSTACAKACNTSNECPGQICCKSTVARSSWFRTRSLGYPVHVPTTGSGGVNGTAGTFGSTAGTTGAGGRGGTTGQAGTFGTAGSGGSVVAGNLIKNGDFTLGSTYWNPEAQAGSGYITTTNGEICILNPAYTYLSYSLGYPLSVADAFTVQAGGIYTLRFRAAALYPTETVEAKIGLAVTPYTALYTVSDTITTSTYQTFTHAPTFSATTSTVGFVLNGVLGPVNAVCFDDVSLIRN
jgi:hypothetical protein